MNLHMNGFTLLWMCLCCLRPEDVAKVLPHSGQVWARAPTCCERMWRCRLLGSVNTCRKQKKHKPNYRHCQACAKHAQSILSRHSPVHWKLKSVQRILLDGIQTCISKPNALYLQDRLPEFMCQNLLPEFIL